MVYSGYSSWAQHHFKTIIVFLRVTFLCVMFDIRLEICEQAWMDRNTVSQTLQNQMLELLMKNRCTNTLHASHFNYGRTKDNIAPIGCSNNAKMSVFLCAMTSKKDNEEATQNELNRPKEWEWNLWKYWLEMPFNHLLFDVPIEFCFGFVQFLYNSESIEYKTLDWISNSWFLIRTLDLFQWNAHIIYS